MALAATGIWETRTGGSDTVCGGMFDPGQTAGMFTDGAATGATGNAPVFSSASYNFVAGDVNAWVFIASGTNWTAGWYEITSVASNKATLNAKVGAGVLLSNVTAGGPTTAAGVATVASPSAATWSIDYSQQNAAQFAYTDLAGSAGGAAATASSAGHPFGAQQVGNTLVITSGTNWVTGYFTLQSVAAGVATFDRNVTSAANAVSGNGNLGGALASPGKVGSLHVAGQDVWLQSGTYAIASASSNIATGCCTLQAGASAANATYFQGYGTVRGDGAAQAILQAGTISTFTLLTTGSGNIVRYVTLDGALQNSSRGLSLAGHSTAEFCIFKNCTNNGVNGNAADTLVQWCEFSGCTTATAGLQSSWYQCAVHDCTASGLSVVHAGDTCEGCILWNITGATSDAIVATNAANGVRIVKNTIYNVGRDGIRLTVSTAACVVADNVVVATGQQAVGTAINATAADDCTLVRNNGFYLNSTNVSANFTSVNVSNSIILTAMPFNSPGRTDFGLNTASGGGSLLRAAGINAPGKVFTTGDVTNNYADVGAAQSQGAAIAATLANYTLADMISRQNQFVLSRSTQNYGLTPGTANTTNLVNSTWDFAVFQGSLYAGCQMVSGSPTPQGKLFKGTWNGATQTMTWTDVTSNIGLSSGDFAIRRLWASNNGYLYAGTSNNSGLQVYRSADGVTWTNVLASASTGGNQRQTRSFADFVVGSTTTVMLGSLSNGGAAPQIWSDQGTNTWAQVPDTLGPHTTNQTRVILSNASNGPAMYSTSDNAGPTGDGGVFQSFAPTTGTTVAAGSNGVNVNTFTGTQSLSVASTSGFPTPSTTVASGSNGVNVNTLTGTQSLSVASTSGFAPIGSFVVVASGGNATVSYSGIQGNTFLNCNTTAGSANGTLSTGNAINGGGTVMVVASSGSASITYTGVSGGNTFLNCTTIRGSTNGTLSTGNAVSAWYLVSTGQSQFAQFGATSGGIECHQMVSWRGKFWLGTHDAANGGAVFWSADLGVTWTVSTGSAGGFGIGAAEEEFYSLWVYQDTLFCVTLNQTSGGRIWYCQDEQNWYPATAAALGDPTFASGTTVPNNAGIYRAAVFADRLWSAYHGVGTGAQTQSTPFSIEQFPPTVLNKQRANNIGAGSFAAIFQNPYVSGT
jgi:hypothetical protein